MKILISNDDGYFSKGINCLADGLSQAGHTVIVFAPDKNYSGSGMAITLRSSVKVKQKKSNVFVVSGTPVDCVNIALTSDVIDDVDILISGINNGANLGDDCLYSGTIAAALEARHLKLPNIACSIVSHEPRFYESAKNYVIRLLENLSDFSNFDVDVINMNVPDLPESDIKGFEITQLSSRKISEPPRVEYINDQEKAYWIGGVGEFNHQNSIVGQDSKMRCDYEAVNDGFVSLTLLKAQLCQTSLSNSLVAKLNKS